MSRYDLGRPELAALLAAEPAYRARQLYDGLYRRFAEIDELTELPAGLRDQLRDTDTLRMALREITMSTADDGETVKWLYGLADGGVIETVLMHHPRRATVCVSSQAGCAMGCTFCATGDAGFSRHLQVGEIVEQVVRAARAAGTRGRRLDHVVFMGMGEPFANFPRVWAAVERIVGDLGIGARNVTISTVGVVPRIRELATKALQVNLAVSLHGANDALRSRLVPLNRRYPIAELESAIADYVAATGRRVSFEWALIGDVNDSSQDAAELSELARRLGTHVNLIPLNPTAGGLTRGLRGSPPPRVRAFRDALLARGVNVTVRKTRGREIDAACGQLAGSVAIASRDPGPSRAAAAEPPAVLTRRS